jgi:glycosyl transferase family 25
VAAYEKQLLSTSLFRDEMCRKSLRKRLKCRCFHMADAISSKLSTWPIYVISLQRETQRRADCRANMEAWGLSFSFFDAVDGARLSNADIAGVCDRQMNEKYFKRSLSAPEIACYMSHYALWKRIAADPGPGAIVLEDDFGADNELPALLHEICRLELSNCVVKLHSERRVVGKPLADLSGGYKLIEPHSVPGYALGYVVLREAAANLAEKALPFVRPVDIDLKHWWEFGISVLIVQPSVLHIRQHGANSAIESSRQATKPIGEMGSIIRLVRNLRYQFLYRVGYFRSRLKSRLRKRP